MNYKIDKSFKTLESKMSDDIRFGLINSWVYKLRASMESDLNWKIFKKLFIKNEYRADQILDR